MLTDTLVHLKMDIDRRLWTDAKAHSILCMHPAPARSVVCGAGYREIHSLKRFESKQTNKASFTCADTDCQTRKGTDTKNQWKRTYSVRLSKLGRFWYTFLYKKKYKNLYGLFMVYNISP